MTTMQPITTQTAMTTATAHRAPPSGAVRRPRVIHVITALNEGGAERQLELLATRQDADVSVLTLYGGGAVADALRAHGVQVLEFPLTAGPKALAWFRLARVLRRERPDVVHVHLLAAQLWGIPAARLARVPAVVSTEHSLNDELIEGRPLTAALRIAYWCLARMATVTLAVSAETAAILRRWRIPARSIESVDNGIDFAAMAFDPAGRDRVRAEFGIAPETRLIGAVGRLHVSKRFDVLLRAVRPVLGPEHRLLIVGAGPEEDALRRLADELGIAEYVVFTGGRDDIPDLYSAMDVMVSPGLAETFGLAIIEALASGLPTVYAMCPALAMLPEQPKTYCMGTATGAAAEVDLRAALARALADAEATGATTTSRVAPPTLVERYGIDITAARLDETYRRHLGWAGVGGGAMAPPRRTPSAA